MARPRILSLEEASERRKEYARNYHAENRKLISDKRKSFRQLNKEKCETREALYRKRNREVLRIRSNDWYHKNSRELIATDPKTLLLRRIRNSARTRGYECTITEDDFEIPELCPVLGMPIFIHKGTRQDNSISMDRIDSDKGYIPGNVQIMSWLANRYKTDMTKEHIGKLYKFVFNS